jgi:hypothetical protein
MLSYYEVVLPAVLVRGETWMNEVILWEAIAFQHRPNATGGPVRIANVPNKEEREQVLIGVELAERTATFDERIRASLYADL